MTDLETRVTKLEQQVQELLRKVAQLDSRTGGLVVFGPIDRLGMEDVDDQDLIDSMVLKLKDMK